MRPATATIAVFLAAAILTLGLLFEQSWTTGIGMVFVGIAFYAMFSKPTRLDPDEPVYGSPEAIALAEQRRQQLRARLPSAPLEGMGVMAVFVLCGAVLSLGFLFEQAWTTGIGMLMVGVLFTILFRLKSRSGA